MRSRNKVIITSSVVLALVLTVAAVLAFTSGTWPFRDSAAGPGTAASASPTDTPSPSPSASATETAPEPSVSAPAEPAEPDPVSEPEPEVTGEPTPPVSQSVSVVITYAGMTPDGSALEAGAYAAIIDGPATCTLTLTKGSTVRSQTVDALADVATMTCGQFLIGRSELSKGTWTAVVTYSSAASSGQSGPSEVVVP